MFLSDRAIRKCLKNKKIIIDPNPKDSDIRPVGIRVHLSDEILIQKPGQFIDLENPKEIEYDKLDLRQDGYILKPGDFILASIKEKIQLSKDILCFIDGRSTIARLGITVHVTSTTADGHYDAPGSITLEMKNLGDLQVRLISGYPIGMLTFSTLEGEIEQKNQSQYLGQSVTTAPNLKFKTGQEA